MASQIKRKLIKNFCDAIYSNVNSGNFNDFAGRFNLVRSSNNGVAWRVALPSTDNSLNSELFYKSQKELVENNTVRNIQCNNEIVQVELDAKHFIKDVLDSDPTKINYEYSPKKVIVEFSSPNIAKPFHVGHLRSTIIGNAIANIKKKFGDNVVKMNFLGDWGTQFGIIQLGVNLLKYSEEDLQKNPLKLLMAAYVKGSAEAEQHPEMFEEAKKLFCDLESGKEEITHMWTKYRKWTLDELSAIYSRLGISFDEYSWESDFSRDKAHKILKMLEEKGILSEDEKKRKVAIVENNKIKLIKSDNTTLYMFRDLMAALERREKHSFDEMYYVVENSQSEHFHYFLKLCSELKIDEGVKIEHVKFGRVQGMSTRKGAVVLLSDVLDEAQERIYKKQLDSTNTKVSLETKEIADILGVSAVIISDLMYKRKKNYEFSWDKVVQLKGNTGVALQYCHSRLCNLEIETGCKAASECDPDALVEPEALDLILAIARYEEILHTANKKLEPCCLTKYLFDFIKSVNVAYSILGVKHSGTHLSSQRLLLFNKSRQVLNDGMKLLGLDPLKKM